VGGTEWDLPMVEKTHLKHLVTPRRTNRLETHNLRILGGEGGALIRRLDERGKIPG